MWSSHSASTLCSVAAKPSASPSFTTTWTGADGGGGRGVWAIRGGGGVISLFGPLGLLFYCQNRKEQRVFYQIFNDELIIDPAEIGSIFSLITSSLPPALRSTSLNTVWRDTESSKRRRPAESRSRSWRTGESFHEDKLTNAPSRDTNEHDRTHAKTCTHALANLHARTRKLNQNKNPKHQFKS